MARRFPITLCLILLLIHVFCFENCSPYVPRRKLRPTVAPTEDPRTNDHNKPSVVRMLKFNPANFYITDGHAPVMNASEYDKIRKMFRIEPHLMTSGKRRKRSILSAGHFFFYNRVLPQECNGSAAENCTLSTIEKRKPPNGHIIRKSRRTFDVPQIECATGKDGAERFACPSPDHTNRYRCIDERTLCDGFIDCPNAEDEDLRLCMFYKTTKAHLDVLADALLRWARGRY